jgi:hypothetical protein
MSTAKGTKVVYAVWAPAEGDSPEDAIWWYFRTLEEADDFANDGWGADYGVTNYSEAGPFQVEEQRISTDAYRKLSITRKVGTNWQTGRAR